ncbi:hypothetical protein BDW42DRAFT_182197 [Aspergillus taichungensis]|uniref:Uncharacterized protein n=1 Tax=Aspergillus taichungensis TaxID=482145 RepID=A0A2J5HC97_9EURO|nr:hypothetical protein BDW42DRAFT_182197 [Aspergillus taichungensis]
MYSGVLTMLCTSVATHLADPYSNQPSTRIKSNEIGFFLPTSTLPMDGVMAWVAPPITRPNGHITQRMNDREGAGGKFIWYLLWRSVCCFFSPQFKNSQCSPKHTRTQEPPSDPGQGQPFCMMICLVIAMIFCLFNFVNG